MATKRKGSGYDVPVSGLTIAKGVKYIKQPDGSYKIASPTKKKKSK